MIHAMKCNVIKIYIARIVKHVLQLFQKLWMLHTVCPTIFALALRLGIAEIAGQERAGPSAIHPNTRRHTGASLPTPEREDSQPKTGVMVI